MKENEIQRRVLAAAVERASRFSVVMAFLYLIYGAVSVRDGDEARR